MVNVYFFFLFLLSLTYLFSYVVCSVDGQHDGHLSSWLPSFLKLSMFLLHVLFACWNTIYYYYYYYCVPQPACMRRTRGGRRDAFWSRDGYAICLFSAPNFLSLKDVITRVCFRQHGIAFLPHLLTCLLKNVPHSPTFSADKPCVFFRYRRIDT